MIEQYLPLPVRQTYAVFAYKYISVAPRNNELPGVYENTPLEQWADISVAFYYGGERHVYYFRAGGDDFRHAAMQKTFTLRVNARNSHEAAQMLCEYLDKRGFKGSIREVYIFDHGDQAAPLLGLLSIGDDFFALLQEKRPSTGYADLYFVNCNVAEGVKGREYIQRIANTFNLRVHASEEAIGWKVYDTIPEGKPNYEIVKKDWFLAVPHEVGPKREFPSKKV